MFNFLETIERFTTYSLKGKSYSSSGIFPLIVKAPEIKHRIHDPRFQEYQVSDIYENES